jgi:signal transduction histidine kinase
MAARQRAGRGESQGLTSMQERVTLAGGAFEIESAPGRGTTIRARFPFEGVTSPTISSESMSPP